MSRGMKKFLPFQSLKEQALSLAKMQEENKKVEKPILSEDAKEAINAVLMAYNSEEVEILYYEKGYILKIVTIIKKIDAYNKVLILPEKKISFDQLLNVDLL